MRAKPWVTRLLSFRAGPGAVGHVAGPERVRWVTSDYAPGDVVIFSSKTVCGLSSGVGSRQTMPWLVWGGQQTDHAMARLGWAADRQARQTSGRDRRATGVEGPG